MEAPNKIYLEKSLSFPDKFHGQWYREDIAGNGVEYISKDLLLAWAKQKQYDSTTIVADNFWQEVIDKIESI